MRFLAEESKRGVYGLGNRPLPYMLVREDADGFFQTLDGFKLDPTAFFIKASGS